MTLHSKFGTVPATWRVVSAKPEKCETQNDQAIGISRVDTQGLDSVWHTTEFGPWSITEALAAIYVGLFAELHSPRASVQFIAPSRAQAMLMSSLLDDFGISDMGVSTNPAQFHRNWRPTIFVVSLPQHGNGSHPAETIQQLLDGHVRPAEDEVVSVGAAVGLEIGENIVLNAESHQSRQLTRIGRFKSRGDLIERLLALSPEAVQQVLPLHTSGDVDNIGRLMGHGDWSDDKVICLCDTTLPPIMASLAQSLSDNEADVLTNSPRIISEEAATSKTLRTMHDFEDEAVLCTSRHWVLVEPQLGRGGNHRNATLLMKSISTARFIIDVALGLLDGQAAVVVPQQRKDLEDDESLSTQPEVEPVESADEEEGHSVSSHTTDAKTKKTRCRRYSDLHAKRLREVLTRMTPEEVSTLLACLESAPSQQEMKQPL